MAYSFNVGYTPIAPSIWTTNANGGTINSTFFPQTGTAEVDLTPLPANFKLTEMWAYLNVSASHATQIDLGVIDVNTGTNSTKPLLYSASISLTAADGTGWKWLGVTGLNIDFSAYVGKRMAAAMGRPLDGQNVDFRYQTTTGNQGGWSITGRGSNYLIPNPFPSGQAAHFVSLYTVFKPINPFIEVTTNASEGKQITLSSAIVGTPLTMVSF